MKLKGKYDYSKFVYVNQITILNVETKNQEVTGILKKIVLMMLFYIQTKNNGAKNRQEHIITQLKMGG